MGWGGASSLNTDIFDILDKFEEEDVDALQYLVFEC